MEYLHHYSNDEIFRETLHHERKLLGLSDDELVAVPLRTCDAKYEITGVTAGLKLLRTCTASVYGLGDRYSERVLMSTEMK